MRSHSRSRSIAGTSFESRRPGDVLLGMKHDSGGDDGAGQAAASHLVDSGHVHEPHTAQRVLQRAHGRNASHMGRKDRRVWKGPAYVL